MLMSTLQSLIFLISWFCVWSILFLDSTKERMCELTVVLSTEPVSDVSKNYCLNKEIVII